MSFNYGIAKMIRVQEVTEEVLSKIHTINREFRLSDNPDSWVLLIGDIPSQYTDVYTLDTRLNLMELILTRPIKDVHLSVIMDFIIHSIRVMGSPKKTRNYNFRFRIYAPKEVSVGGVFTRTFFTKEENVSETPFGRKVPGYIEYTSRLEYDDEYNLIPLRDREREREREMDREREREREMEREREREMEREREREMERERERESHKSPEPEQKPTLVPTQPSTFGAKPSTFGSTQPSTFGAKPSTFGALPSSTHSNPFANKFSWGKK